MKCVCGYEQGWKWDNNENNMIEVNPNGDKFIKINGCFTVDNTIDGSSHYDKREIWLCICPKCNTVTANI